MKEVMKNIQHYLGLDEEIFSVRSITRIAILAAIAAVLKTYFNIDLGIWRLTFYGIPLIILGIFLGPIAGMLGGLSADFAYIMYKGWTYGFNIFTISAMMWGLLPALLMFRRAYSFRRLLITVIITSTVVFILNTIGLVQIYGDTQLVFWKNGIPGPLLPRLVTYLLKLPIQVVVVDILITRLKAAYPDL